MCPTLTISPTPSGLFDAVDDAVVAVQDAVTFLGGEFLGTGRARVVAQGFDTGKDARHVGFRNTLQVFNNRGPYPQFIACHRP